MTYTDFTLDLVEAELGVGQRLGVLFRDLREVVPPVWLTDQLARGLDLALVSEKARSEFIVAPLLLAVRALAENRVSILSGERLDVDPRRGLVGECDFLLSLSNHRPRLQPPRLILVQAKRNDIEAGLGQCAA